MNAEQAKQFLSLSWPGLPFDKALLEMTKAFLQPLNMFVSSISDDKSFTTYSFSIGRTSYRLPMKTYPKNNPAEVLIRAAATALKYPNATANYIAGVRNFDAAPETGEPITIAVVVGVIAVLGPVILPFVVGLVDSFIKGDQASKAAETKAVQETDKRNLIAVVAVVVVIVVGILVARRTG